MQQNDKSKKQVFSVAKKYDMVYTILDAASNKSEFICQAIIEKARMSLPKNQDEKEIEAIVYKALDKYFLEKGVTKDVKQVECAITFEKPPEAPEDLIALEDYDALNQVSENW